MQDQVINNVLKYANRYYPYYNWEITHENENTIYAFRIYAKSLCLDPPIGAGTIFTYDPKFVNFESDYMRVTKQDLFKRMVKSAAKLLNKKLREIKNASA